MAQIFSINSGLPIYDVVSVVGIPGIPASGVGRINEGGTLNIQTIKDWFIGTVSYSGYISSQGRG